MVLRLSRQLNRQTSSWIPEKVGFWSICDRRYGILKTCRTCSSHGSSHFTMLGKYLLFENWLKRVKKYQHS